MTALSNARHHQFLSSIEEVVEDARNGRMFIRVDAEDRENEGDLVMPAQMATPDAINFMAKHGRGLICLALTHERAKQLSLSGCGAEPRDHSTAFTVSIEAREGVSTGISAHDRARTISVAMIRQGLSATSTPQVTSSHCGPRTAACWCAPGTPRPRSIWHEWQAFSRRA